MIAVLSPENEVTVAWITLLGLVVTTGLSFAGVVLSNRAKNNAAEAKRHASEANDAVNHRHPQQPRLFDMVLESYERTGRIEARLDANVARLDERNDRVEAEIGEVKTALRQHIDWVESRVKSGDWDGIERRQRQQPFDGPERRGGRRGAAG